MDNSGGGIDLYPRLEPYRTGRLAVGGQHRLYFEECGNPRGQPVVFLHGGPGAGCAAIHRRFFDPNHYRIILLDQRGAGRSTPFASIEDNTTQHLIADLEKLRTELHIDRWLVFGGSWGATLALCYAIEHSERISGLILRGIFTGRAREGDWFLHDMGRIFPEAAQSFVSFLPEDERGDVLGNYYRRLINSDPAIHLAAAQSWSDYEGACSTLMPRPLTIDKLNAKADPAVLALARLEAHYFVNNFFIPENHILDNIHTFRTIPGMIVQGRYDIVCPIETADELARNWPGVEYRIIPDAGHSTLETGIRRALVMATEAMKVSASNR